MGYFDNLFPGLQQQEGEDPYAGGRVRVPKGAKVRRPGEDFSRRDEEFATEADEIIPDDGIPMADETPDVKSRVKTAHADIQGAFGEAMKVLKSFPASANTNADPEGAAFGMGANSDSTDIANALAAAQKRDNPIKLADDLRVIATRRTIDPQYAKMLHGAADKLTKAYKAQGELDTLRQPGQPLAVTPQEVAGRGKYLADEIAKREDQLKTAGSLRAPQLQKELQGLRAEEGRVSLATQSQPQHGSTSPAASPEDPSGSGKPIEGNFNALGVKKDKMVSAYVAALEGLGISPDDLDSTVPFETGMLRVMSTLDPQAKLATRAMAEIKPWMDPSMVQPHAMQGEQQQNAQGDMEMQEKKQRIRQLYAELGTSPFGNTWLGLISYVLLGMLAGPQLAARIVGRRNDGALKGEIEYLKADIRDEISKRDRRERDREAYRRMYVQHHLQSQRGVADDQRSFRQQFILTQMRGAQALQRAQISKKGVKDPVIAGLEQDFRNASNMAGKYAQAMDMEKAAAWNKKAESLIPLIQQRRAQLNTAETPEAEESEE